MQRLVLKLVLNSLVSEAVGVAVCVPPYSILLRFGNRLTPVIQHLSGRISTHKWGINVDGLHCVCKSLHLSRVRIGRRWMDVADGMILVVTRECLKM